MAFQQNLDLETVYREIKSSKINEEVLYLSAIPFDVTFQCKIKELKDGALILSNPVHYDLISAFCASKKFIIQCRSFRLQSDKVTPSGTGLVFPIQETSIVRETRSEERFFFTRDEQVICHILNPHDGTTTLQKKVLDMSTSGLSIVTPFFSQVFKTGTELHDLKILIDQKIYLKASVKVIYHKRLVDLSKQEKVQVGLKIEKRLGL